MTEAERQALIEDITNAVMAKLNENSVDWSSHTITFGDRYDIQVNERQNIKVPAIDKRNGITYGNLDLNTLLTAFGLTQATKSVSDAEKAGNDAVTNIENAKDSAMSAIDSKTESEKADISTHANAERGTISTVASNSIIDVEQSRDTAKTAISSLASSEKAEISTLSATKKSELDAIVATGISNIQQTVTSTEDDGNNEITITLNNGTTKKFTVQNGSKGGTGSTGNGISSIAVSESTADGGNNVVTINMTNGTFKTFNVKNGSKGADGSSGGGSSDVSLKLIAGSENATGSGGFDTNSDSDINSFIETGIVKWAKYRNISGLPNGDGLVQSIGWRSPLDGAGWGRQIAYDDESNNIYSRYMGNGSWSAWKKVLVDGDINLSGYVPTSRTINGKALTGNISLSASDLGATKLSYTTSITRNSWSKVTLPSCNVGEIKLVKASLSSVGGGEYVGFYTPSGGTYVIFKLGYHTSTGGGGEHSASTYDSMYFSGGAKFYEYGSESDENIDNVTVLFGRIS